MDSRARPIDPDDAADAFPSPPHADAGPPDMSAPTVLGCNDDDLRDIAACLAGDDTAFTRLTDRYQPILTKQMQGFARDPESREELLQDVFLEVFRSLESFRGDAPFEHWIRRVASRVGYRHWKRQNTRPVCFPLEDWDMVQTDDPPEETDPKRTAELLQWLLAKLKPKERQILVLLYLQNLSVQQIADRMGLNRAMVKMRVYRAKRKLQAVIAANGIEFPLP